MSGKKSKIQKTLHERHRAHKPRPVRPLDVAQAWNHATRRAGKLRRIASFVKDAKERFDNLLDNLHDEALYEDLTRAEASL